MVNKYARDLEERNICAKTGEIWTIDDVPSLWNKKVRAKIKADGYEIAEDGTVINPNAPIDEQEEAEADAE